MLAHQHWQRRLTGWPQRVGRWTVVIALCLIAGAAVLAVTRADALLLDVGRLIGCI
jgi:hypothetical protein